MLVYLCAFFFNDTATTEIYTLSLHDALPISERGNWGAGPRAPQDPGRLRRALHLLRDDARAGRESVAGNPGTGSGSTGARGAPRGDRADGDTYRHEWAGTAWEDRPLGHAPGFTGGFGYRLPPGTAPGLVDAGRAT